MKAVLFSKPGDPDVLTIGKARKPAVRPGMLRVRARATALNRADLLQREGKYPPPKGASEILGLEVAGEVDAVGKGVDGWKEGDRVFGLLPGGGYAEYCLLHAGHAMRIPGVLSFEEAAAVPEAFLTAYQALYWLGRLEMGDDVLVHAGGSGVGTAAIQLAVASGATVHVTASKGKHKACRALGAKTTIDYHHEDFVERVRRATRKRGANVIIDVVGAPYFGKNLAALAVDGRLVLLATMGGRHLDGFDLRALFRARASVTASTLRNRSDDYKCGLVEAFSSFALELFEQGRLKPVVDTVYNWVNVADAHRRMEANRNTGKLVLRIE